MALKASQSYGYFMGDTPQGKQTIAAFMRLGKGIYDMMQNNKPSGSKKTSRTRSSRG